MNTKTSNMRHQMKSHRSGLLKLLMASSLAIVGLGGVALAQDQGQDQAQQDQGQFQQDQGQGQFQQNYQQNQGQFQGQGGQGRGGGRRQQQQFDAAGGGFGGGGQGGGGLGGGGGRRGRQQQFMSSGAGGGYNSGYSANRTMTGDGFSDQYGAISEHNIFMADRRPPVVRQNTSRVLTAEESYVLTGIVLEDNEYRAYAENVSSPGQPPVRLRVNDPIARGKVADITIDQLAYEHDGEKTWITAGSNLTGTQVLDMNSARSGVRNDGGFTGNNGGAQNLVGGGNNRGNFNGQGQGGFTGFNGINNNNFNNGFGGGGGGGGRGGGGGGRRGGGGGVITPVAPPPPLPGGDAAGLSLEERMKLRRLSESMPSAAIPQGAVESLTPPPAAEAPAPAPAGPILPGAANLSDEEQMRLRRAQELNGGR